MRQRQTAVRTRAARRRSPPSRRPPPRRRRPRVRSHCCFAPDRLPTDTRFTNIFGAFIFEMTMRPSPPSTSAPPSASAGGPSPGRHCHPTLSSPAIFLVIDALTLLLSLSASTSEWQRRPRPGAPILATISFMYSGSYHGVSRAFSIGSLFRRGGGVMTRATARAQAPAPCLCRCAGRSMGRRQPWAVRPFFCRPPLLHMIHNGHPIMDMTSKRDGPLWIIPTEKERASICTPPCIFSIGDR
jgi:hypothetical protein